MKLPKLFFADRASASAGTNAALHRNAVRMLRRVAHDLRLPRQTHEVVVMPARRNARSRVTLQTDSLFVDVIDKPCRTGVAVCYRTRRGRTDLSGGGDNYVPMEQIQTPSGYQTLLDGLRLAGGLTADHGGRQ
jgi:hypothetical protein